MKKLLTAFLLTLMTAGVFAAPQRDDIMEIFSKYETHQGVEAISISQSFLKMMATKKNQAQMAKIQSLNMLTVSHKTAADIDLMRELSPALASDYEEVMKSVSKKEKFFIYLSKNSDSSASKLLLLSDDPKEFTMMCFTGKIDKEFIDAIMNGDFDF